MQTACRIEMGTGFGVAAPRPHPGIGAGDSNGQYAEVFDDPVPPELLRWALCTGQGPWLEQLLAERVARKQPVTDWHAFARPLVEPLIGLY